MQTASCFQLDSTRLHWGPVQLDARSLTRDEWIQRFGDWDQPVYRVDQLLNWLYPRRVSTWEAMSNLPKRLREQLATDYKLGAMGLVRKQGAKDTTQKFLWRLEDGAMIESVLIPASPALYGEQSDRHTLCLSTQVGCAYGCRFCASGLEGWKRNLRPEEIVNQILGIERWHAASVRTSIAGIVCGQRRERFQGRAYHRRQRQ